MLGSLALNCIAQGRFEGAQELFEQALAIMREVGLRRVEAYLLRNPGNHDKAQGRSEEARELYEKAPP